jgi:hypothetical protein
VGPNVAVPVERTVAETNVDALTLILRFHEIAADAAQIRHRYGSAAFGANEILRYKQESLRER